MTVDDDDPFDMGVPRGRYGRPLIIPVGGGEPVEYTRVSTFAGALSGAGFDNWNAEHAAVGVACSEDLAAMIGALGPNPDLYDASQKAQLAEHIATAHDRSGGNAKAHYGTAIHTLTEPDNAGYIPARMAGDVDAYWATLKDYGLEVDATEQFVVNDLWRVAGTFDHMYRTTRALKIGTVILAEGHRFVGDKKTGKLHHDQHAIQLAAYADGSLYDHKTGTRAPLEVDHQYGIVVHIPNGAGKATLHLVSLEAGRLGCAMAREALDYVARPSRYATKFPTVEPIVPAAWTEKMLDDAAPLHPALTVEIFARDEASSQLKEVGDAAALLEKKLGAIPDNLASPADYAAADLLDDINTAPDRDTCAKLWRNNKATWTDQHQAAVIARLAQLDAAA